MQLAFWHGLLCQALHVELLALQYPTSLGRFPGLALADAVVHLRAACVHSNGRHEQLRTADEIFRKHQVQNLRLGFAGQSDFEEQRTHSSFVPCETQ